MWREQDYLRPRALLGYFPCYSEGNDIVVLDPEDRETELERFTCPRQPQGRPHLPGRLLPPEGLRRARRRRDHGGHRPATEVTELMARLEDEGEFAEQLFTHGLGVQTAEGLAEWLHSTVRADLGIDVAPGPPLLVGLPGGARPVRAREGRASCCDLEQIGMTHLRRLRARARAVDAGDHRPPPRGDVLRDEVGHAAVQRPPAHRRRHRRQRPRSHAPDAAARRGSGRPRARPRPSPPTPPRTGALRPLSALRSPVVNLHGRSLAVAVPAALALIAPAAAGAACAQRSIEDLARTAPVVVTAKAQPGPVARNGLGLLSPATFKVVAYEQGTGPQEIKVRTALTEDPGGLAAMSDGVNPMAGQTWRLWGTLGADGVLQTSVCLGSTLAGVQQTPVARRRPPQHHAARREPRGRPARRPAADRCSPRAAGRSSCACPRTRPTSRSRRRSRDRSSPSGSSAARRRRAWRRAGRPPRAC